MRIIRIRFVLISIISKLVYLYRYCLIMNDDTRKFFEKLAGTADEEAQEFEPQLVKAERIHIEKPEKAENEDESAEVETEFDEGEGSLAIDVFQTENDIVVMAPIAGVAVDDLDIDITPESVTIKGKREKKEKIERKDFLYQECYWGRFSRSIILPQEASEDRLR